MYTLLVLTKINCRSKEGNFWKKKKTCSDRKPLLSVMLYQLHRYIFKGHLERVGGKKMLMQLLCKLPLKALDGGGHRKAPVHWHSLTWLEALSPLGHHRADAFSLPEIRYSHLTQPDELYNHLNVNKRRLHHSKEKLPHDFRSYLICPSVDHLSPFKELFLKERSPSSLPAQVRQTCW